MEPIYRQFDVVRLLKTDSVTYLCGPSGRATAPKGEWTVVAFVEGDMILAKQSTIVRVSPSDVVKIADYDLGLFVEGLQQAGKPKIDVVQAVSKTFDISQKDALDLCKKYKIPLKVDAKKYEERAINKLRKILNPEAEDDPKEE